MSPLGRQSINQSMHRKKELLMKAIQAILLESSRKCPGGESLDFVQSQLILSMRATALSLISRTLQKLRSACGYPDILAVSHVAHPAMKREWNLSRSVIWIPSRLESKPEKMSSVHRHSLWSRDKKKQWKGNLPATESRKTRQRYYHRLSLIHTRARTHTHAHTHAHTHNHSPFQEFIGLHRTSSTGFVLGHWNVATVNRVENRSENCPCVAQRLSLNELFLVSKYSIKNQPFIGLCTRQLHDDG